MACRLASAIIWTNAGILLIEPLGRKFSEILIEIRTFSFNKMHLKVSSSKWRPFCLGLNVLKTSMCHLGARDLLSSKPHFVVISARGWQGLGWGLLSQFPPFLYFPNFSSLPKHTLTVKHRIDIWQVSPQLSCGDTCQIWMWFEEFNMYFCETENFAYGEINERSFSNPHPRRTQCVFKPTC